MIEATNIILNYGLDSSHYTTEDFNLMDEWRVRVQTYLDATKEDSITARRQFERFEDTSDHMEDELEYDEEYE